MKLGLLLLIGSTLAFGADCTDRLVKISIKNGHVIMANRTSKAIVGYVVVSSDRAQIRTGVFNRVPPFQPKSSFDLGSGGKQYRADFVEFIDGSSCGASDSEEAVGVLDSLQR
jgi:hypothetical protein